jgi:lipoyl-dependent peroxiredoxin subunit D
MDLNTLRGRLPETAKDVKLNLSSMLRSENLNPRQLYGTLLATAFATRNADLYAAARTEAAQHLEPADLELSVRIASTMAMNNVYYRFVHLVENPEYGELPARLRMQALAHPPEDRADRELWALAVSAVNGCGMCIRSHEQVLRGDGVTAAQIQDAVRIAAIVASAAAALDGAAVTGGVTAA